jgi:hypothetical protein
MKRREGTRIRERQPVKKNKRKIESEKKRNHEK